MRKKEREKDRARASARKKQRFGEVMRHLALDSRRGRNVLAWFVVQVSRLRVQGSGIRAQGSGFRFQIAGFRV
jgi:hypothetical protein